MTDITERSSALGEHSPADGGPPEGPDHLRRRPVVIEPLGHIPALDGLRAVAVMAVLLYHARFSWIPGGFLGVSMFFTLSGFLITSLLLREWNSTSTSAGSIDLRRFWRRRFRRLLPASWCVLGVVVLMGLLGVWDTEQLRSLRGDVPFALAEIINWHFIAQDRSYGTAFVAPSPLEHYWSLAVEQQFYVVLPLVVVGVLSLARRRPARHGVRMLVGVFVALAAFSAIANGVLARSSVDRAYFGTDTRMAEMLVGSLLACAMLRRLRFSHRLARRALAAAALVAGVITVWLWHTARLDAASLYPWGLLLSAVCTAALIAAAADDGVLASVLSVRPLVWLGGLSYGIYLLHWPIFLWLTPLRTGLDPVPLFGLRFAVTLLAAMVMYQLVEHPIRSGGRLKGRAVPVMAVSAVAALLAGTFWVTRDLAPPPVLLEAAQTTTPPPPPPVVDAMVIGDQFAGALSADVSGVEGLEGLSLAATATADCGLAVGGYVSLTDGSVERDVDRCANVRSSWVEAVADARPDVTIVMPTMRDRAPRRFSPQTPWAAPDDPAVADFLRSDLVGLVEELRATGTDVVLATAPDVRAPAAPIAAASPVPADPTAAALSSFERLQIEEGRPPARTPDVDAARTQAVNAVVEQVASSTGVQVLDLRAHLQAWPGGEFDPELRAADGVGLSEEGAADVGEWLAEQLADRAPSAAPAPPPPVRDPDEPLPPAPPASPRRVVGPGEAARVLVVGDSVAYGLGYSLGQWGGRNDAEVTTNAQFGCAIARGGQYRFQEDLVTFGDNCDWGQTFPPVIAGYRPDVVVVSSGVWEVVDRRLPGDDRFRSVGSPDVDRYVLGEFLAAIDTLGADGATVVLLTQPYLHSGLDKGMTDLPESETARTDRLNELIVTAAAQRPGVARVVDLKGWLAAQPGGELDPNKRPDGLHFADSYTPQVADWLGPNVVAVARGQAG